MALVNNKTIIVFFVLFLLSIFLFINMIFSNSNFQTLEINGVEIKIEIADTAEKRKQGLSGRKSLAENQGMLFVYDNDDYYAFTMRGMNFPLDFIWIRNSEVVDIIENVQVTESNLKPKEKVNMILEVNAGFVEKYSIKTGDIVNLR